MAATETEQTSGPNARRRGGLLSRVTRQSRFYWVRLLLGNPSAVLSGGFLLGIIVLALLAPVLTPHDPAFINPAVRLSEPSSNYWFGTDGLGRDVLARAIYGARVSLVVGLSVMVLSALGGSIIGLIAGYYPRIDSPIMRVMDGMMAFPSILLAIAIMASLGPRTGNVIVALTIVYTPTISRLVRGTTLVTKNKLYVMSARAVGLSDRIILSRYIFANGLSPLIVQCTFVVAFAIISEASLSFLGAGVPPETPTWGNMVREGQISIQRAWWLSVFPGTALFLTVLALNLLGDGLRDALDPRARGR